ncbi:MAG: hypothetical protein AB2L14_02605 [Candidatus Xenobiia bacterium LiM19]
MISYERHELAYALTTGAFQAGTSFDAFKRDLREGTYVIRNLQSTKISICMNCDSPIIPQGQQWFCFKSAGNIILSSQ